GYTMPQMLTLRSTAFAALHERYDLIGFDPRGVGYSTRAECSQGDGGGGIDPPVGPITEAQARQLYDSVLAGNQACFASNSVFLRQLTTANVARDLDRIRGSLGLRTIDYFGVSWGTLLGSVYRSLFPATIGRMWLDSVVGPHGNRLDARAADTTA